MQIVESDPCKCCKESRNARERKEGRPYLGARESLKRKRQNAWDHFSFRYISPPLLNKDLRSTHRQYRQYHRAPQISIALNKYSILSDSSPVFLVNTVTKLDIQRALYRAWLAVVRTRLIQLDQLSFPYRGGIVIEYDNSMPSSVSQEQILITKTNDGNGLLKSEMVIHRQLQVK